MYSSDSIGTLGLADQIHAIICEMAIDIHVSILLIPSLQAPHCWYGFEYVKSVYANKEQYCCQIDIATLKSSKV